MIESQVRALFTGIANGEPGASRVDTQLARRRGRARLRWRRAGLASAPLVAAAAVAAVALAVGAAAPPRPGVFGHHMQLLGRNPAHWTSKPIG